MTTSVSKVHWSNHAEQDYWQILLYLYDAWDFQVANGFIDNIEDIVSSLLANPFLGKKSEAAPDIRSISVHSNITLYYKVNPDSLLLLRLFDVRQHPNKRKL